MFEYSFPFVFYKEVCHLMLADENEGENVQALFYYQNPPNTFSFKSFCQQPVVPLLTLFGTSV